MYVDFHDVVVKALESQSLRFIYEDTGHLENELFIHGQGLDVLGISPQSMFVNIIVLVLW